MKVKFIAQIDRIWRTGSVCSSAAKRSLNLMLAWVAKCVLMRLALVIKYASARLVSVFYSRERRNFTVCVCISQDRSIGRPLLALAFCA